MGYSKIPCLTKSLQTRKVVFYYLVNASLENLNIWNLVAIYKIQEVSMKGFFFTSFVLISTTEHALGDAFKDCDIGLSK